MNKAEVHLETVITSYEENQAKYPETALTSEEIPEYKQYKLEGNEVAEAKQVL